MNPNHKIVASGKNSAVHTELAELRYKCGQMKKSFKRERWVHIVMNIILTITLAVMLLIPCG